MKRGGGCLAILFLCFWGIVGCGEGPPAKRLFVLGIDGMDPSILRRLMDAGEMPHFSQLAQRGGFKPLGTSMPPQSPVAWSSFITGTDPAGHGIFDFVHRSLAPLAPFLSTSRQGESGEMELLRQGTPFWDYLAAADIAATIFKVPANFPPGQMEHGWQWNPFAACACSMRAFAGMGTPDILGTYGTFTYYTDGPYTVPAHMEDGGYTLVAGEELEVSGGRIVSTILERGQAQLTVRGPDSGGRLYEETFEIYVDRAQGAIEVVWDEQRQVLKEGEWSQWLSVDYGRRPYSMGHLTGIVRLYLKAVKPHLQLYMTPVNIDPANAAMPVSLPTSAAVQLQEAIGPYYTQGMPDETKALEAGVFDYEDFLRQDAMALEERRRQLRYELKRFEQGLLFFYVHSLDQLCHMLWRATDEEHPGYRPEFARFRHAIRDQYIAMDRLLGEALVLLGDDADIVIMSDHGFAAYERSFNLNTWLAQRGYLGLDPATKLAEAQLLKADDVRWKQTRAYGLGLNSLYLNLWGREQNGIVEEMDRDALLDELERELLALRDPLDGRQVVKRIERTTVASGNFPKLAPDLLIGYARGYRVSGKSAVGELEAEYLQDNLAAWSGDHCMAAEEVPGVLLSNKKLGAGDFDLRDIPVSILTYYGIESPAAMQGRPVWDD